MIRSITLFIMLCLGTSSFSQTCNDLFTHYLLHFPLGGDSLTMPDTLKARRYLTPDLHRYLPPPTSEDQYYWASVCYWRVNGYIITLCARSYHTPSTELAPYAEYWLISYDAQGQMIDKSLIGKIGDLYGCDIEGHICPMVNLRVYRITFLPETLSKFPPHPCLVNLIKLTMDERGHFTEHFLWNTTGTWRTSEDNKSYLELTKSTNIRWLN